MTVSIFEPSLLLAHVVGALTNATVVVFGLIIGWLAPGRRGLLFAGGGFALISILGFWAVFDAFVLADQIRLEIDPSWAKNVSTHLTNLVVSGVLTVVAAVIWAWLGQQAKKFDVVSVAQVFGSQIWISIRTWGRDK